MAAAAVAVQDGLYLRTGELINLQRVDIVVPQRAANHRDFTVAVQICPRDRPVVTKAGLSNITVVEVDGHPARGGLQVCPPRAGVPQPSFVLMMSGTQVRVMTSTIQVGFPLREKRKNVGCKARSHRRLGLI